MTENDRSEILRVEVLSESDRYDEDFEYDVETDALYVRLLLEPVEASLTIGDVSFDLTADGRLRGFESISPPDVWVPDESFELPSGFPGQLRFRHAEGHNVTDFDVRYLINSRIHVLAITILPHAVAEIVEVSGRVRAGLDDSRKLATVWVSLAPEGPLA